MTYRSLTDSGFIGVMLTEGLPTLYTAASGEPKPTLRFGLAIPRLPELRILLGVLDVMPGAATALGV